jgi:hypothetical protein
MRGNIPKRRRLIRDFFTRQTTIRNFTNTGGSGLGESSGRSWQHGGTAQAYVHVNTSPEKELCSRGA